MIKIPLEYTIKIGKILIEFAGANSRILKEHSDFISYLTEDNRFGHEYRFIGSLGSGGKLYTSNRAWRISCYREDETSERLKVIGLVNSKLQDLYSEYKKTFEK